MPDREEDPVAKQDELDDAKSVKADDSSSDVESKLLGLDHLTGVPSEIAEDTTRAPRV